MRLSNPLVLCATLHLWVTLYLGVCVCHLVVEIRQLLPRTGKGATLMGCEDIPFVFDLRTHAHTQTHMQWQHHSCEFTVSTARLIISSLINKCRPFEHSLCPPPAFSCHHHHLLLHMFYLTLSKYSNAFSFTPSHLVLFFFDDSKSLCDRTTIAAAIRTSI